MLPTTAAPQLSAAFTLNIFEANSVSVADATRPLLSRVAVVGGLIALYCCLGRRLLSTAHSSACQSPAPAAAGST